MIFFATWSLGASITVFLAGAVVIGVVGTRLSGLADRLADRSGLGEAFMGAVFLGASTSLPGITASVTAAIDGFPTLSLANAFGGIAAQTAFLIIADLAYPKANLEHAAASVPNMMSGALLITLLAAALVGMVGPPISLFGVHIVTPLMLIGYVFGMRLVYQSHEKPMWKPRMTSSTRVDEPDETTPGEPSLARMWVEFVVCAGIVMAAGWFLTRAAESLVRQTNISESLMGGLLIAVSTSLPELVTSIAAVRRGALTLAVGGVLGGNAFDTLFAAIADIAYRKGPIYQEASGREIALVSLTILMSGVLLLGLLHREKKGIGFEGVIVLALWVVGMVILGVNSS